MFSHNLLNARKQKKNLPTSYLWGQSAVSMRLPTLQHPLENKVMSSRELRPMRDFLQTHQQEPDFFGSRVTVFSRDPSHWSIGSYVPFLQGSHMRKQHHEGLLWAAKAVPSKDYFTHLTLKKARKGRWVISPDYHTSHPRCFCAVGDVVAQRYDVLRDWLWDACHMAGVCWGSRCEGFWSKEGPHYALSKAWGTQQSTLFMSLEIPWGFHTRAVLRSLARPRSCKKVSVQEF